MNDSINYGVINKCITKVDESLSSYDNIIEKWYTPMKFIPLNKTINVNSFIMRKNDYSGTKYLLSYVVVDMYEIMNAYLRGKIDHLPENKQIIVTKMLHNWNMMKKILVSSLHYDNMRFIDTSNIFFANVIKVEPKIEGGFTNKELNVCIFNKINLKLVKFKKQLDNFVLDIFTNNLGNSLYEYSAGVIRSSNYLEDSIKHIQKKIASYYRSLENIPLVMSKEDIKESYEKAYNDFYKSKFGEEPTEIIESKYEEEIIEEIPINMYR